MVLLRDWHVLMSLLSFDWSAPLQTIAAEERCFHSLYFWTVKYRRPCKLGAPVFHIGKVDVGGVDVVEESQRNYLYLYVRLKFSGCAVSTAKPCSSHEILTSTWSPRT